jgi:hypothetical protein
MFGGANQHQTGLNCAIWHRDPWLLHAPRSFAANVCRAGFGALLATLFAGGMFCNDAQAQDGKSSGQSMKVRAVVELFTSQGCSSCPPADKLLGELAKDPSLVAVTMPIDYWDYLGGKDTLANPKFTARQRAYAGLRGDRQVYTPQTIINGEVHALGSSRADIESAIQRTAGKIGGKGELPVQVSVSLHGGKIKIAASDGPSGEAAEVWICGLQKNMDVEIGRGENRGTKVTYHNVMRRWLKVADWTSKTGVWDVPAENITGDGIDAIAVYVQRGQREKPGVMLGAAFLSLPQ